jgi:CRISPR-associated endoribonuclease Cas6
MPLAAAIRLSAGTPPDGPLPFLGPGAGGWLLDAVSSLDPMLGEEMTTAPAPFSVAVLGERGFPSAPLTLRVSALTDELEELLREHLLPEPGEQIELAGLPLDVTGVAVRDEQFPLAASFSWDELGEILLKPPNRFPSFEILTPVAFDENGRVQPFPLAGLFYGSLLERWNAFAPVAIPAEVRRFAEECLVPREFELRSRRVRIGATTMNGAAGRFSYTLLRRDPYYEAPLAALGRFAFFAGAGMHTSQGMGLVVPRP